MAEFVWIDRREAARRLEAGDEYDSGILSVDTATLVRLQQMFYEMAGAHSSYALCRAIAWDGKRYIHGENRAQYHAEQAILAKTETFDLMFVELEPCHTGRYRGHGCREMLAPLSGTVFYAFRQWTNNYDADLAAFVRPLYEHNGPHWVAQFYCHMLLGIGAMPANQR